MLLITLLRKTKSVNFIVKWCISKILNNIQADNNEGLVNEDRNDLILKDNDMKIFNERNTFIDNEQSNVGNKNIQNQENNILRNIVDVGTILWCTGILVLISILIVSMFNFKIKSSNLEKIKDEHIIKILNKLKQNINVKTDISMYICDDKKSPCILGIVKPKIYLPQYVLKLDDNMISHILLHELMHYKRKDLYINLLCWIMLLLHWLNPLVWIAEKKLKTYREYACDSCVLQILGEEKNVDYGMTIINLSKIVTNKRGIQLGLGFERNNVIKGRIEMIKNFKNGSYKISAKSAFGCMAAAVIVCTNGITVDALDINNALTESNINETSLQNKHEFLIDDEFKQYYDINKVREVAGFDFKLPDYNVLPINKPYSYTIIKLSNTSNLIQVYYDGDEKKLSLEIFKDDPVKALSKIYNIFSPDSNIESSKKQAIIGNIKGYIITLNITNSERVTDGQIMRKNSDEEYQYFVWENEGVYYSILYSERYKENKSSYDFDNNFFSEVADSLKNIDDIKNIELLPEEEKKLFTDETTIKEIYDKDDLKKAEGILGFNPKLPLKINEFNIKMSTLEITVDSDVEKNIINYEVCNSYRYNNIKMSFSQSKHDNFGYYNYAKNNGYINFGDDHIIDTEEVNIDGTKVYRYIDKCVFEKGEIITVCYLWEKDGIYYSATMSNTDGYHDEIVKELMNSKPIE